MTSHACPVCNDPFDSASTARDHAWKAHNACGYCNTRLEDETERFTHWLVAHEEDLSRIDRKQAETAIDTITIADRFEHQSPAQAASDAFATRRGFLASLGVVGIAGVGGAAVVQSQTAPDDGGASDQATATASSGSVPVPDSPSEHRYAIAGHSDAGTTITYFGSWKCPYCADFSTGFLHTLIADYVESGDIAIRFRNLSYLGGEPFLGPDAPALGHAGLSVWNEDPAAFWPYHEYIMANQPSEQKTWGTAGRLISAAKEVGVKNPQAIETAINSDQYASALQDSSAEAATHGITGTPKLLVDGKVVNPFKKDRTRRVIENAIR